jgi:hypothetical protein
MVIHKNRICLKDRDDKVVRLTNQVHELELSHVAASAVLSNASNSSDSPGCPGSGHASLQAVPSGPPCTPGRMTSNGISFDSDRFEFREFVDVGSQTNPAHAPADQDESLRDAVTAYEMQNRFLNKEVLELNQLRQQASDREQKLFMCVRHIASLPPSSSSSSPHIWSRGHKGFFRHGQFAGEKLSLLSLRVSQRDVVLSFFGAGMKKLLRLT